MKVDFRKLCTETADLLEDIHYAELTGQDMTRKRIIAADLLETIEDYKQKVAKNPSKSRKEVPDYSENTDKKEWKFIKGKAKIEKAKKNADFVIVSCHWGVSDGGTYTVAVHQRGIGQAAITAGADLVLGHHQHAYQGVERYQGKIICHGLGNFIFDALTSPFLPETVLFHCTFQKNSGMEAWIQPILQDSHAHPYPLSPGNEMSQKILLHFQELSKELGTSLRLKKGRGIISLEKGEKAKS